MRLHVLSDLHNECQPFTAPVTAADVVILAGDIDEKARGPAWALQAFASPVVFVPGNHDFWGINIDRFRREAEKAMDKVNPADRRCPELHILDAGQAVTIKGVRFVGAPLWTDFALAGEGMREIAMLRAGADMKDYQKIRMGAEHRRLSPARIFTAHRTQIAAISAALDVRFEGPTVLVTHHPAHPACLRQGHGDSLIEQAAFASDLRRALLDRHHPPALVVSGHTHVPTRFTEADTLFLSNPRGGSEPVPGFEPGLILDTCTLAMGATV